MIVAASAVRPMPGHAVSGDAALVLPRANGLLLVVIDALGHGVEAARVADTASEVVQATSGRSPVEILHACEAALRHGRGAAISLVSIDHAGDGLFIGVGNVAGRLAPASIRHGTLVPSAGIVGGGRRTIRETPFRLARDGIGALTSDGIRSGFDPGLVDRHRLETSVREELARHARPTDDAALLLFAHASQPLRSGVQSPAR